MGIKRRTICVAVAMVVLAACASPADAPVDADGSPIPLDALDGIRVEGPATLLEGKGGRCWAVRYDDGESAVLAPLLAPPGHTDSQIAMADPMNPGQEHAGPALMDAEGDPVGFVGAGAIIAATYRDASDPTIAGLAQECGWDGPVLVADDPYGVTVDPDGLTGPARVCTSGSDQMRTTGEATAMLEGCALAQ